MHIKLKIQPTTQVSYLLGLQTPCLTIFIICLPSPICHQAFGLNVADRCYLFKAPPKWKFKRVDNTEQVIEMPKFLLKL